VQARRPPPVRLLDVRVRPFRGAALLLFQAVSAPLSSRNAEAGYTPGRLRFRPRALRPRQARSSALERVCLVSEVKRSAILPGQLFLDRRQEIRKRTAPAFSRALYLIRQRLIFVSESKQHFNRTPIGNSQCHGPIPMGALP
jgi:hypothetical protein